MSAAVTPFSLKDAPALIERLLPVQKLSAEVFKERKAGAGQTLVPLGAYWKGRKPLILNKACILGCLLPATDNPKHDLEIFEKLMAMDDESFVVRWPRRPKPREVLATLSIARIGDYFLSDPPMLLPQSAPVDWSNPELENVKVNWRDDISELERRRIEVQMLPRAPYRKRVETAKRPEEVMDSVHAHIWEAVNAHLGTSADSFPELVEQLGVMRFGHRPRVADTFCGSGQIPFEAARLGCDAYGSDLIRPRVKGETTFVDGLIAFAVDTANQCLVPQGIAKSYWDKLTGVERFYLKMLDMEARGAKTLDNYQNFGKAFKVRDFQALMASRRANQARVKSATEFGRTEMGEGSEFHQSVLRAVLYGVMELVNDIDGSEVLAHLTLNIPNYYGDMTQRELAVELSDYLAKRLEDLRSDEAGAARVLRELVKNQRLG